MSGSPPLPCPDLRDHVWHCIFFKQLNLRFLNKNNPYTWLAHSPVTETYFTTSARILGAPGLSYYPTPTLHFSHFAGFCLFPPLSHCLDCMLHSAAFFAKITLRVHTIVLIGRFGIFSECHPFAQPKTLVNILNAVKKSGDEEKKKKSI